VWRQSYVAHSACAWIVLKEHSRHAWLRVSSPKTKLQNFGAGTQLPTIVLDGNTVESVVNFVYLLPWKRFRLRRLLPPWYWQTYRSSWASTVMSSPNTFGRTNASHSPQKTRIYLALVHTQPKPGFFALSIPEPSRPFMKATAANQMAPIHLERRHLHLRYHQSSS